MSRAVCRIALLGGAAASLLIAAAQPALADPPAQNRTSQSRNSLAALPALPSVDIPYTKMVLDNGLTLIVHEDRKAPIVAVNVWYHVGSKHEPVGRSGFAHLFEHLMFNGSENFNHDFFKATEPMGATDMNGTTNEDRTNYFQNVPTSALDSVLWLESDRMGHLLGAVDQAKLDEQRGVVQNEKRQGETQPYGRVWDLITEATYPVDHPYGHTVIGSMDDLNAATLEDVQNWFKTYYGPSNAVIVLAGDISPEEARAKVEHYFGDIPPGPPVAQPKRMIAKMTGAQSEVLYDRVGQPRLYKVWNVPPTGDADTTYLQMMGQVLSSGRTSRLHKRLVFDDQVATNVYAGTSEAALGSQFMIVVTAKAGQDLAHIEAVVDEELARLLRDGPTADELERARTTQGASFVRGLERIGGFGGKSDILARSQVFHDDPGAWKASYERLLAASPQQLTTAGRTWLTDGSYSLHVVPFGDYKAAATGADRSALPAPGEAPQADFPAITNFELSNGMPVKFIARHGVPTVSISLLFEAGGATDAADKLGLAQMTAGLLSNGTKSRTALEISDQIQLLGATLGAGASAEISSVTVNAISSRLDATLDLYADVVRNPAFRPDDVERARLQQVAAIQQGDRSPNVIAQKVLTASLYGPDHPYGRPVQGYEATVSQLTPQDAAAHHAQWYRPDNATFVVVGDVSQAELKAALERAFADWRAPSTPKPQKAAQPTPPRIAAPKVRIVDRAGPQSTIMAGRLTKPLDPAVEPAIDVANTALGGAFTSRINMNLREDKHWSYGAFAGILMTRGDRIFYTATGVQADKTAESLVELKKELSEVTTTRPLTQEEIEAVRSNLVLGMAGNWETNSAVQSDLNRTVTLGMPENYFDTYAARVAATTPAEATAAAREFVGRGPDVWVVVGDRADIEPKIRALNLGEVEVVDVNGRPVN